MRNTAAVVAHFDPDNQLDENFRVILSCLEEVCERIVLVTTSVLPETELPSSGKILTIQRPNVGYDFYSYRVGIEADCGLEKVERLFLINSSVLVLDKSKFSRSLMAMLRLGGPEKVVGATDSLQISWHLQTYLLLLGGNIVRSTWFKDYLESIQPENSKFETILKYELGLSRLLKKHRATALSLFKPKVSTALSSYLAWMRRIAALEGVRGLITGLPLRHCREVNWTHFAARDIAVELGFVKTEVLRANPHGVDLGFVELVTSRELIETVQSVVKRTAESYHKSEDGLTAMRTGNSAYLPASKLVQAASIGRPGVRIAVLLHLYYVELLEEICAYLKNIPEPFDLYVTTPLEGSVPKIINRCAALAQGIFVSVSENRGRDIGPFVALYRRGLLDRYEAVLKLHSKRSSYSAQGDSWRRSIYDALIGNSLIVLRTLHLFSGKHVGIVGPHQYYLTDSRFWGGNRSTVRSLLIAMNLHSKGKEPPLSFFAGSMFWFDPRALRALKQIPEAHLTFEPESGKQDATLAHALERIFCIVSRELGYPVTSVDLQGAEIEETDTHDNQVPVL